MKIFLSVPFSSRVDENNIVHTEYRKSLETLTAKIRESGYNYFLSLEHANWKIGDGGADPKEEFQKDFDEIDSSDIVIAYLEERISAGIQLELGYSYAKGKQVYLFQSGKVAWSNMAFASVAGHNIVNVESDDDFVSHASELVVRI